MNLIDLQQPEDPRQAVILDWLDNLHVTSDDSKGYLIKDEYFLLMKECTMDDCFVIVSILRMQEAPAGSRTSHRAYPINILSYPLDLLGEESLAFLEETRRTKLSNPEVSICRYRMAEDKLMDYLKLVYDFNPKLFLKN